MLTAEINLSPITGEEMYRFINDFNPYDVIVMDYTGDDWSAATHKNFLAYVQNDGSVVVSHVASNVFPN